ncbi:hypothetical protein PG989_000236 [Apiospora arundinis]
MEPWKLTKAFISFDGPRPAQTVSKLFQINGATVANINVFFDRLDAPELANIPPERFYNTDEMGIG